MPLYPLIIGDKEKQTIFDLVEKAFLHPVTFEQMKRRHALYTSGATLIGFNHLTIEIPAHYMATFTIEEHEQGRKFRHLSVSIIDCRPGRGPTPQAVSMIAEAFQFRRSLDLCVVYPENLANGAYAVNVIEPL